MKKVYAKLMRWKPISLDSKGWTYRGTTETVEVMVEVRGYAMVRFKGCGPFVVALKELAQKRF